MKMKFGHHGANHPVQDIESGAVMITSQNHGFAIDERTLPANLEMTHKSLFDQSPCRGSPAPIPQHLVFRVTLKRARGHMMWRHCLINLSRTWRPD